MSSPGPIAIAAQEWIDSEKEIHTCQKLMSRIRDLLFKFEEVWYDTYDPKELKDAKLYDFIDAIRIIGNRYYGSCEYIDIDNLIEEHIPELFKI